MDTMKDLFLWTESGFGNKEAIVDFDRGVRWNYSQLNDYARRICASYALDGGVKRGDRVGWLSMSPSADILALSFGVRKMGAIPVTMNARASAESLAWMINNVEMKALAYSSDSIELLEQIIALGIPTVKLFVAIDGLALNDRHLPLADLYQTYTSAPEPDVKIEQDDVALIVYTSGSTGRPKPIMHTEATWAAMSMNLAYMWALYFDDRFLTLMPPHFVGWAHVTSATLRAAASQVCLRFDPASVARAVQQEQCTHAIFTPTLVRILAEDYRRNPSQFSDNQIRIGMLGGETITDDVLGKLREMFPRLERTGTFGATEAVPLHTGLMSARAARDPMLLGKPLPGVTVELRDVETGELVTAPDTPGVLLVKGPIAAGIWNDPEATEKSFPGGWWYSGDVISMDKDGYMSFSGRSDHMFKSGAIKVFSEEVEEILKRHPNVLDAIVVPVPDDRFGQVPLAFVRHNAPVSGEEFERWWREQAAPGYCRPRYWSMSGTEPFPMVTAAKVDRRRLRDLAQQIYSDTKQQEGAKT